MRGTGRFKDSPVKRVQHIEICSSSVRNQENNFNGSCNQFSSKNGDTQLNYLDSIFGKSPSTQTSAKSSSVEARKKQIANSFPPQSKSVLSDIPYFSDIPAITSPLPAKDETITSHSTAYQVPRSIPAEAVPMSPNDEISAMKSKIKEIKSLKAPKPLRLPSHEHPRSRPSMTEQLDKISKQAAELTASLRCGSQSIHSGSFESPLLSTPASSFIVGRLSCKYPSPVSFFNSYCSYIFHHPFQNVEIHMLMRYGDMTHTKLNISQKIFQFRVKGQLDHFGEDYDPSNKQHLIKIGLASQRDCELLKSQVLPMIVSSTIY